MSNYKIKPILYTSFGLSFISFILLFFNWISPAYDDDYSFFNKSRELHFPGGNAFTCLFSSEIIADSSSSAFSIATIANFVVWFLLFLFISFALISVILFFFENRFCFIAGIISSLSLGITFVILSIPYSVWSGLLICGAVYIVLIIFVALFFDKFFPNDDFALPLLALTIIAYTIFLCFIPTGNNLTIVPYIVAVLSSLSLLLFYIAKKQYEKATVN